MACEYCREEGSHRIGCPLYEPKKSRYYCLSCGQGINDGEEYIVNNDGEYRHYDCFFGMRDLLEWLGYEVKTFEDDNYD